MLVFGLTNLSVEFYLHQHSVFLASSSSEYQKTAKFFKRHFSKKTKKKDGASSMKAVPSCWDMEFVIKEITILTSNFA
jgi:hypothetical protein